VGGEYAGAYSADKFTPVQRAKLLESLQATYDRFTGIVAEGRKLPLQKVQEIARGRVWSGEDALANGLVNKTGDLMVAIDEARQLAGFKEEDGVDVRLQIQNTTPFQLLTSMMTQAKAGGSVDSRVAAALASTLGQARTEALLSQLSQMGQSPSTRAWMPPVIEH
jgi:protease-4